MKTTTKVSTLAATIITIGSLAGGANAALTGTTVVMEYTGNAGYANVVSTTDVATVGSGVEFMSQRPGGTSDLFQIDLTNNLLTITALEGFTDSSFLSFNWEFTIQDPLMTFDDASLVSNTLFSNPPFTNPVHPTVGFDTLNRTLTVSRFIAAGIGTATITNGGIVEVSLSTSTVPEPSSTALLGLGGLALMFRRRR
jgi:hypothetical protein